ncbi:MAG: MFS transporter [Solirubrobacterales bacterium]
MLPRPYRRLLAIRSVRAPLAGVVVGRLPIAAMSLATVLLIRHETGSFAVAGAVEACIAVATAVSLPLQGRLVDRYGQTRILVPVAALNPLAMTALVLAAKGGAGAAALGAIGVVCGASVPALGACMRTLWRDLVPDNALRQSAFALDAVLVETAFITGPLLTAALVSAASPALAVLVNAGLTLTGAATFAVSRASRRWRGTPGDGGWAGPLASPRVALLVAVQLPLGAAIGAMEVATVAFCTQEGAPGVSGALIAVQAAASMAGGLWYGSRTHGSSATERYPGLLLFVAATFAPLTLVSSFATAFPLMTLSGFGFAPSGAVVYQLIDELAPPGGSTESTSWVSTAVITGVAAGSAIAGAVVGGGHAQYGYAAAVAAAALAAILALGARPAWRPVGQAA